MNGEMMPSAGEIEAARLLLDRLGVAPEHLLNAAPQTRSVPTFNEFLDRVTPGISVGTARAYGTYWNRIRAEWGERRIDEPTGLEIQQMAERVKRSAVVRRNSRGGRFAAAHLIAAFRCMYRLAVADQLIDERNNPAAKAAKPRRHGSTRRALLNHQLHQINEVAATTGDDPELDTLLLRLHVETACRRGGALALRTIDLDAGQCLIRLREKGETERWQPVSPTLMDHLLRHAEERGDGNERAQLLRYRTGRPITPRRYDHLWKRIGRRLPWVKTQQVTTHWLRHTTLTWVERSFGYAVARAFAGHNNRTDLGATATYVRADLYEVAIALSAMTSEAHPLVPEPDRAWDA